MVNGVSGSTIQRRMGEIIAGRRSIATDTVLRLAWFFKTDAQNWMNLQTHHGLAVAEEKLSDRLDRKVAVVGMSAGFDMVQRCWRL